MAEAENKISAEEAAEFAEFKKSRREAEYALALGKLVADASMPMLGDAALIFIRRGGRRGAAQDRRALRRKRAVARSVRAHGRGARVHACPEHLTELMQRELLSEPPAALKK